jgi:hypothetical protein
MLAKLILQFSIAFLQQEKRSQKEGGGNWLSSEWTSD